MSLDLIVFSRDREKELLATLWRISDHRLRVCVFHNTVNKLRSESIPKNVTYVHSPGMNYGERAQIARSYLENDFCAISSDDDGICEYSIKKMANWLSSNPKYSSVGGLSVGAFPYGGRVVASAAYREMNGYILESEDAEERLKSHLLSGLGNKPPRAALYRIYRRNIMDKMLEVFAGCSVISTPYIFEVCAEVVSAWAGPTKYINHLYWIRNWHTEMISRNDWNRKLSFHEWWTTPEYVNERARFLTVICEKINVDENYLKEIISEYTNRWHSFFKSATNSRLKPYPKMVREIGQRLKIKFIPNSSLMKIENVLLSEFSFLSLTEQQEVCNVAQEMFYPQRKK